MLRHRRVHLRTGEFSMAVGSGGLLKGRKNKETSQPSDGKSGEKKRKGNGTAKATAKSICRKKNSWQRRYRGGAFREKRNIRRGQRAIDKMWRALIMIKKGYRFKGPKRGGDTKRRRGKKNALSRRRPAAAHGPSGSWEMRGVQRSREYRKGGRDQLHNGKNAKPALLAAFEKDKLGGRKGFTGDKKKNGRTSMKGRRG